MKINYYSERTTPRIKASQDAPSSRSKAYYQQQPKIIKFIGDMQENVNLIVEDIECQCHCKGLFTDILLIFGNKIQKLRAERNKFKSMLNEIHTKNSLLVCEMEKQIEKINQENLILYQKFKELQKNNKKVKKTEKTQQNYLIDSSGVSNQPNIFNQFSIAKVLKAVQNLSPVEAHKNLKQYWVSPHTPFQKRNQQSQQKSFTLLLSNSIYPIRKQQISYDFSDISKGYDEILDKNGQQFTSSKQKTPKKRLRAQIYDAIVTCDTQNLRGSNRKISKNSQSYF